MTTIFVVCGLVVAVWLLVRWRAKTGAARDQARVAAETRAAVLRSVGLGIDGDPIGSYAMQGTVHGVEVTIDGRAKSPLASASSAVHPGVTAITVRVALPDQVVCRRRDVDEVVGSDPATAQPTGDPSFDERYAVFVEGPGASDGAGGYRDPPSTAPALAWVDPQTLGSMVERRLVLLRVRDGVCHLAFDPTAAHEVGPLVAIAANVARRSSGEPLVAAAAPPFVAPVRSFEPVTSASKWAPWALLLSPAAFFIAFAPPLRALNAEAECGPRGEIRVSENDADGDGTSYGLYCWNDGNVWGPPMVGHHASALAILVAVAFGIVTAVSLSRWPAKARG